LGSPHVNGHWMLFAVFFVSCLFQVYFVCQVERADFFRRPCLAHWLEYAATSPVQVVLVASCVMIRDVYTLGLLFTGQLVCVLLGFPIECALQNERLATRMLEKLRDGAFAAQLEGVCNENECECDVFKNVETSELKVLVKCDPSSPASVRFFDRARATSRHRHTHDPQMAHTDGDLAPSVDRVCVFHSRRSGSSRCRLSCMDRACSSRSLPSSRSVRDRKWAPSPRLPFSSAAPSRTPSSA
jgi:hypothetical protein